MRLLLSYILTLEIKDDHLFESIFTVFICFMMINFMSELFSERNWSIRLFEQRRFLIGSFS